MSEQRESQITLFISFISVTTFMLYWLANYPGQMSADSLFQWQQMETGNYTNVHPAFHTWTNYLITRLWHSPAAVTLVQVLVLSGLSVWVWQELHAWQVSIRWRSVVLMLLILPPVNGFMITTLWKDIAYADAVLILVLLLARLVRKQRQFTCSIGLSVGISVTFFIVAMYRHNGFIVVVATGLVAGLWLAAADWKKILGAMLIALLAQQIMTRVVYPAMQVTPMSNLFAIHQQIYQLGAVVKAHGDELTDAEKHLLQNIQPLAEWKARYNCSSINTLFYNSVINTQFIETHVDEVLALWRAKVVRYPRTIAQHALCTSQYVWRITSPPELSYYTFHGTIDANDYQLAPASRWPALHFWLRRYANVTMRPAFVWLVWRPALYLYFGLVAIAFAIWRTRQFSLCLLTVPLISHSLFLLVMSPSQEFRYQYPVYLTSLFLVGLAGARQTNQAVTNLAAP